MGSHDLGSVAWRTSSYTTGQGNCVEVGVTGESVLVRDTKDRAGGVLAVVPSAWAALLGAVR